MKRPASAAEMQISKKPAAMQIAKKKAAPKKVIILVWRVVVLIQEAACDDRACNLYFGVFCHYLCEGLAEEA